MIEAITSCDPLDPSATEWTPRRTATDPPPRTHVPVKDPVPPDPVNKQRRRRRQRRTPIVPHQHRAAAYSETPPAGPPPKPVEQTCDHIASSPPTIVEQVTPLPTTLATKPHHFPSTKSTTVRRRRRRHNHANPLTRAAAHTDSSSAGPPPILVEQTSDHFAASPPNIVEQATPLPTPIVYKPHHLRTPKHDRSPATKHRLLPPPSSVEQAFPMLPPQNVESVDTTTCTPIENTSPSPPLNYFITTNISTNPTVSSSSTSASTSRRRHFPTRTKAAPHPHRPQSSDLHQATNMCYLAIAEAIIDTPSLLQPSATIDKDLSQFLIEICDAEYTELPSLLNAGITTMHQIATVRPSILQQHELPNDYFHDTVAALNWWARKHHLCSRNLFLLTSSSFDELRHLFILSTTRKTRRTPRSKQPSRQPHRTQTSRPAPHIPFVSPLISPSVSPTTTTLNNNDIYNLAPDYFNLHPDIFRNICEHNMSFHDFAIHHPNATTTMIEEYDEPTIRSMFQNCTFIDANTPLSPTPSHSSSSKSNDTCTSWHSSATNYSPSYSYDENNNYFSGYSSNQSDYTYHSQQEDY